MSDTSHGVFREEGFGRKVGPLPIWGWAIVLAAVAFIYVRFVAGRGSSSAASSAATGVPNIMTTGGYLPASQGSGSVAVGTAPGLFTDNTSWENAAIQGASQYGSDPVSLQQALDSYLHGGNISPTQQSLIGRVISAIGAAPLGTSGTPTVTGGTGSGINWNLFQIIREKGANDPALGLLNTQTGAETHIDNMNEVAYIQQMQRGQTTSNTFLPANDVQGALALGKKVS